jgi:SAM-dependent methyltransferase
VSATPLYDAFSDDYDRFVDWRGRLAHELPFIRAQLATVGARRVLDAACGTGRHTLALAAHGYEATGADISAGMVQRARENAAAAGSDVQFVLAGFGELAARAGRDFDALLCLGNSLPHALTAEALVAALEDFAAALRPGGLLMIQNRNFDAVMQRRNRWMEPQVYREAGREWVFVRFYDFNPDGTITFNVLTLRRDAEAGGDWSQQAESTRLRPLLRDALTARIKAAGFEDITAYGDMTGAPFDAGASGNLVITAKAR